MKKLILLAVMVLLASVLCNAKANTYSNDFTHSQTYFGWGPAVYYGEDVRVEYNSENTWMNIVKENKDGTYDLYQVLNQVGQAEIYSVATDELIEIRKFIAHERDVDDGMDAGDWSGTWYVAWALDFSKLELLDYEWKIPGVYHFRSIAEHGVYTVYEYTVPGVMTYSWI